MYASKNFCNIDTFVSNIPSVNSSAGELTPYAATFARELGTYQDAGQPGYTLYNFRSMLDDAPVVMDAMLVNQAVALVKFCVDQTLANAGEIFGDELLTALVGWGASNDATFIVIGPMNEHNGRWVPDWIRWKSGLITGDNETTVWLSIESFVAMYSDYDIVVVPPIVPLDNFFLPGNQVELRVNEITTPLMIDKIQAAREEHPESILRSDIYDYINPLNSAHRVPTNWPVLVYGPAGNNIDAIKDAMIDYILANSTHSRTEWTQIFPDIFRRTEFIIAPHWQKYALPNLTLQHGVYSPTVNAQEAIDFTKLVANEYTPVFVAAHMCVVANTYRSLQLSSIGGAENRDQLFRIDQVFPDYIAVPTTSTDFNRMSLDTQAWVQMINNMLVAAETMNATTTMPQGMMKITRGGVLYVAKTYKNIQYLVASKKSIYDLLGLTP